MDLCWAHTERTRSMNNARGIQIIRHSELVEKLGISRSTLYAMRNPRSPYYDSTLPRPLRLSKAAVGFLEHEVDEWLARRATSRGNSQ